MPAIPDPHVLHPMEGHPRVTFLKPLVASPTVEIGDYSYYDHPTRAEQFEEDCVLYGYGPERLVIGRYCALAADVRFIMNGANHPMVGPSTFPFPIFGGDWAEAFDVLATLPSRGDTVVGNDVWLGYEALVMPGVRIGDGAVVAARSVLVDDVPPYAIVGGNPGRVIRMRYEPDDVERLLRAAWWDWPVELVTEHVRTIMSGSPADIERIADANGLSR
jgi:virginiamycin A acetyltransferase